MNRVPVLSPEGEPLMPTKPSRCRRWLRDGKAKIVYNDLGVFCIQLINEPSAHQKQDVVVGIDPGKHFTGIGVQTTKSTLFKAHLELPFKFVNKKMTARRILRRARRGRRINRKIPFANRCHKQKRFDNRRQSKLPPSIRANREFELRIVQELTRIFPVNHIVYEIVKAKGDRGFSPVMVGQKVMLVWLEKIADTSTQYGWQTSNLRTHLGLTKDKSDKSKQTPETHANDGIALAASHFIKYQEFQTFNTRGHHWVGECKINNSPFAVIARPQLFRRQLHFENPDSKKPNPTQYRKRKGGTITPFGFRSGDWVLAEKAGKFYRGWIGGFTQTDKSKNVSIYEINWHRIGQFSPNKVKLLQRRTNILYEYP
jgi:hypothetical protein